MAGFTGGLNRWKHMGSPIHPDALDTLLRRTIGTSHQSTEVTLELDGTNLTTGQALKIGSTGTALTGTGRLLLVDHTGTSTSTGVVAEIASTATDTTTLLRLTGNTSGLGGLLDIDHIASVAGPAVALNISTDNTTAGAQIAFRVSMADEAKSFLFQLENPITAWSSSKNPESQSEDGWLQIQASGTTYYIPVYLA